MLVRQVVLTGDFYQLPPIGLAQSKAIYCFDADCWSDVVSESVLLWKVHRQADDEFVTMLNEIREGAISDSTLGKLQATAARQPTADGITVPTKLHAVRNRLGATC
jgi:ATP-dependent DNA helicase PIF1